MTLGPHNIVEWEVVYKSDGYPYVREFVWQKPGYVEYGPLYEEVVQPLIDELHAFYLQLVSSVAEQFGRDVYEDWGHTPSLAPIAYRLHPDNST